MNQPLVYMCPLSRNPAHLPPHPIPLGCPSAPALSALFHASNLDWSSISHMVIYMFQCYSLKSSHPHLLPQSPKVCFYICVASAVLHIGSRFLWTKITSIHLFYSSNSQLKYCVSFRPIYILWRRKDRGKVEDIFKMQLKFERFELYLNFSGEWLLKR